MKLREKRQHSKKFLKPRSEQLLNQVWQNNFAFRKREMFNRAFIGQKNIKLKTGTKNNQIECQNLLIYYVVIVFIQ